MLIVNPVSMKYNGGKFFSYMSFFGNNATIAITKVEVRLQQEDLSTQTDPPSQTEQSSHTGQSSQTDQSHHTYYIIGSGVGIIVIIFLVIGVVKAKELHYCSNSRFHPCHENVQPSPVPSRKYYKLVS